MKSINAVQPKNQEQGKINCIHDFAAPGSSFTFAFYFEMVMVEKSQVGFLRDSGSGGGGGGGGGGGCNGCAIRHVQRY